MSETVLKILRGEELVEFRSSGIFRGSVDDLRDGFIHLSTFEQIAGTLAKHFTDRDGKAVHGLSILSFKSADFGDTLRWEASRNGDLFPHVYGDLMLRHVQGVSPVGVDSSGKHVVSDEGA